MASLGKLYGTNKQLETEGVEVDLGEGLKVKVARANNKVYREALRRKLDLHRKQVRNRTVPEDVLERLTIEAMSEGILLGWTGAEDGGQPIEYSRANAIAMLTKYPDFRDHVAELASDMRLFQEESEEAAAKN